MDVHATSCTAAVMNAQGKRPGAHVIATSGAALVEFLKTQAGTLHLCIEEGERRPSNGLAPMEKVYVIAVHR
jgi:hypothetical protein